MRRGRALAACLNGEVICISHSTAAAAPHQDAAEQQEAGQLPAKRRRVADPSEQQAGGEAGTTTPLVTRAAGSSTAPGAAQCSELRVGAVRADAASVYAAAVLAAAGSPIFGRPAVDAASGTIVCATVAGDVLALSTGAGQMLNVPIRYSYKRKSLRCGSWGGSA